MKEGSKNHMKDQGKSRRRNEQAKEGAPLFVGGAAGEGGALCPWEIKH